MSPGVFAALLLAASAVTAADSWSPYEPLPQQVAVPEVSDPPWQDNPIDRFIRAAQAAQDFEPAAEVDRRTWLRRVTFDLLGLPPTPEQVAALLADPRPDAIAREHVVEQLLASPHYGERWARHWLDVVRYADTDGFAIDSERPQLWRYRDYVIRHFNEDRPYDTFVREQLAGDELATGPEAVVATSFYRLGPYEADNMVPENRQQDFLNEITTTIGTAFLGLTVGCARCHDHKYDPIPQSDFYRLQAFLHPAKRDTAEAELTAEELVGTLGQRKVEAEAEFHRRREAVKEHREKLRAQLATALSKPADDVPRELLEKALAGEKIPLTAPQATTEPPASDAAATTPPPATFELSAEDRMRFEQLKKAVEEYADGKRFAPRVDTIVNPAADAVVPVTHVLENGDVFAPGEAVQPGCLTAVRSWSEPLSADIARAAASAAGRRRVLAEWVANPENPLTMRVYVNRIWQHHFGRGLVETANDFGINGSGCSHPELLDFLTRWFVQQGMQTKPLHRLIVLSRTYRTASQHAAAEQYEQRDPNNRLLWRGPLRRLGAEEVRDSLLAISGQLNTERGGPGFFEQLPEGMPTDYPFFRWEPSLAPQRMRRSIYMFQRRNLVHPMMEAFDAAEMSQSCERRSNSVTAAQALTLFNGLAAAEASQKLAERLRAIAPGDTPRQLELLFLWAVSRQPEATEQSECVRFLSSKTAHYAAAQAAPEALAPDVLALRDLCLVLLNTNEFLYLD